AVTLNGRVSYPVVADGKVFVTTGTSLANPSGNGATLYALDDASGSIAWGPVDLPGTYGFSGHAYDYGKLFVVNFDGQVRAMDAATGSPRWTTQVDGWVTSAPTAANGVLYVGGGTLNAIDESNGNHFWKAYASGSADSSPTVSDDGVFVSYPCQVYKFERFSNRNLWHYDGGCSGGGGKTSVYGNGRLYVRDYFSDQIFDAGTGTLLGTYVTQTIPAITGDTGYFLTFDTDNRGTLKATDLATQTVRWSFTGDDHLVTAPLVVDDIVIIGSTTGMIFALKAGDGSVVWSAMTAAPFEVPGDGGAGGPVTGLGVGDGYLFAPSGNTLNAWKIVH
ncbi:MAG: PQQ-binding-like beta-propeller repeat protein, partial [Steroidobacteraceae bacterium]